MDAAQASGVLCGEASGMPELGAMQLHVSAMMVPILEMQGLHGAPHALRIRRGGGRTRAVL